MVTSLIDKGRDQGYLLSDEVVAAFPNAEEQLDILEDFYSSLVAEGIEVLDQVPAKPTSARPRASRRAQVAERAAYEDARLASATRSASTCRRSAKPIC